MRVLVRYFAVLREQAGCDSRHEVLPVGCTAAQAYALIFPPTPAGVLPVMFAVNQCYVRGTEVLHDGDELAFIPPLGGG